MSSFALAFALVVEGPGPGSRSPGSSIFHLFGKLCCTSRLPWWHIGVCDSQRSSESCTPPHSHSPTTKPAIPATSNPGTNAQPCPRNDGGDRKRLPRREGHPHLLQGRSASGSQGLISPMNLHSRHRLQSPQESKSSNTDESPSREQELRSPAYSFVG